jgi:hypothetical protein
MNRVEAEGRAAGVRAALKHWAQQDYLLRVDTSRVLVSLGSDLVCRSDATSLNAASSLANDLAAAGFTASRGPAAIARGEESVVGRQGTVSTPQLAVCLYGPEPGATEVRKRSRLTTAAQWARRQPNVTRTNPGFTPALWPAPPIDVALGERAARSAAGKSHEGTREGGGVPPGVGHPKG